MFCGNFNIFVHVSLKKVRTRIFPIVQSEELYHEKKAFIYICFVAMF